MFVIWDFLQHNKPDPDQVVNFDKVNKFFRSRGIKAPKDDPKTRSNEAIEYEKAEKERFRKAKIGASGAHLSKGFGSTIAQGQRAADIQAATVAANAFADQVIQKLHGLAPAEVKLVCVKMLDLALKAKSQTT